MNKSLIIVILISMLLGGCQNQVLPAEEDPVVIAQGVDATTLDPAMHSETSTGNIERQIFDCLLERTADMQIKAAVAESWRLLDDTTWEFTLRSDINFHDGVPLTAADVKFSLERILEPANQSAVRSNYSMIKEVSVIDDYTLTIETTEPYPVLLSRLCNLRIVPAHYVQEVGNQEFGANPIGSGPYRLASWEKDEAVKLVANEEYWGGEPEIKTVIFKPIPEASSRVMALQSGEVDLIVNVPPHQVEVIEQTASTELLAVPSTRIIFMPITMSNGGAVADVRVRKALNYAINVEQIIETILSGKGEASSQPLSTMDFGYLSTLQPYAYDPDLARSLLAEAGFVEGLKLTMQSTNGRYLMDKEVAEAVKAQLEAVGIEVELTFPEWGVMISQILSGQMKADIWLIGWGSALLDADGTLYQWFHTGQPFSTYSVDPEKNARIDALLETGRSTMDASLREQAYHEVLKTVQEDAAWINLYQQYDLYGISKRIQWQPRSDEVINVSQITWSE